MIYVLTGPVGAGKSMLATQRAIDYASQGRRVASNYHIDFAPIARRRGSALSRAYCEVLNDRPSADDLEALGIGGSSEEKAGLVVIDEAGTFLNARTWNDKERAKLIRWMLLSRKKRWDMVLIVQAVGILDKQIREAVVEVCGRVRRLDRVKVPGTKISLPRMHLATMRYGTNPSDVVIERWWTRGDDSVKCYDTTALFESTEGPYCALPATLSKWRYMPTPPLVVALRAVWCLLRGFAGLPVERPPLPPGRAAKALKGAYSADALWKLGRLWCQLPPAVARVERDRFLSRHRARATA